jgi:hypothetical protein
MKSSNSDSQQGLSNGKAACPTGQAIAMGKGSLGGIKVRLFESIVERSQALETGAGYTL